MDHGCVSEAILKEYSGYLLHGLSIDRISQCTGNSCQTVSSQSPRFISSLCAITIALSSDGPANLQPDNNSVSVATGRLPTLNYPPAGVHPLSVLVQ